MKRLTPVLTLACLLSIGGSAFGQQTDSTATSGTMMEDNVKTQPKQTNNQVSKKQEKPNLKNNDNLFQKKKKSWAIGIHGGYPMIIGDMTPMMGMAYGGSIRKALGNSFSLRLSGTNGYATGANWKYYSFASQVNNNSINGKNDPNVNYGDIAKNPSQRIYANYRMNFTQVGLDGIFAFNNVNFLNENPKFGIYLLGGVSGMLFDTWVDQLDASGNMYDYSPDKIPTAAGYSDRKTTFDALKKVWDGNYETAADGNNQSSQLFNRTFTPAANLGLGMQYQLSKRIGINLEGNYNFTGNDLLDGQRWYGASNPSSQPDAFVTVNLGLNIRLGRTDNVYWFTNPLAMPYKTIMENKKKLQKVDKLEKDVDELGKRVDTLNGNVNNLMADADNDGVSDYFDKEDDTPEGAVVNGAGETILFKDKDGNLIYNDPNIARKKSTASNIGKEGYDSDGNMIGADGKKKSGKYKFNSNDPDGKTLLMRTDNKGGLQSPGTSSAYGYLPAVFFESNGSKVSPGSYPELYEVARIAKQNPNVKLHIIGHADYRNSEAYNKSLGMQRAKAVAYALKTYFGVPESQMIVESKGEIDPLSNAKNMNALAANRRVQFSMEGVGESKTDGKTETKTTPDVKKTGNQPVKTDSKTSTKKTVAKDPSTPAPNELKTDVDQILNNENTPKEEEKKSEDVFTPDTEF